MFKVTLATTRENTTVLWQDPTQNYDRLFDVLSEAAKRNITAVELFSSDNLTRKIVWTSPSEEVWNEFSTKFLLKDGKIDDDWFLQNNITYTITRENIDD